jgi:predicted hydrocarbon binding protein
VPEFGAGSSSAAEATQTAPITQSAEEPTVMPKTHIVEPVEDKVDKAEEPKVEEIVKMPKILSPLTEAKLSKVQKASAATPNRRRMANVLDAVLETTKALSPAPTKKIARAAKSQAEAETGQAEAEATQAQAEAEAGPSVPTETKPVAPEEKAAEQIAPEKIETPAPEDSIENVNYIIWHTSGKKLSEEEILEARHYARKLKYPKGALVFNGTNEEDFLYCLPDNKEISVCREIGKSIGFPKLEDGLSILSKDELADSLAYNSINV